jgi:hypothetical protein
MQKVLIGIIILASLLAGLSAYLLFRNSPIESVVDVPVVPKEEVAKVEVPTTGASSLMALATLNQNLECSIVYQVDEGIDHKTEGTYFTSLGRMRGDFVVSGLPTEAVSSVILKDGFMYSWTEVEGQKFGMKVELDKIPASGAPDTREPVPLAAEVDYKCQAWDNVDGSVFEVPTDIVFTDYSAVVNQGMEYGTSYEGATDACGGCKTLVGELREQCMASLQCE